MIIELAGLPGVGKTTFAKELEKTLQMRTVSLSKPLMMVYAILFCILHSQSAYELYQHVHTRTTHNRLLRRLLLINSWFVPMAKYQYARMHGGIVDQGFLQSLIATLTEDKEVIQRITRLLPKADVLILCEADSDTRRMRLEQRGHIPREEISQEEAQRFLATSESVYESVKRNLFSHKEMLVVRVDAPSALGAVMLGTQTRHAGFFHAMLKHISYICAYVLSRKRLSAYVLMYHAVDRSGWKQSIEPHVFERQMAYVAKYYAMSTLDHVVSYAKKEQSIARSIVSVTFDDGYADFVPTILPVLERYSIPVTLFLTTDVMHDTNPRHTQRISISDIQILANHPLVTIESHAQTHRRLPSLSEGEVQQELTASKAAIVSMTKKQPRFFAYAYGDRSPEVEKQVQAAGYEAGFSITEGSIGSGDEVLHLKRIQVDRTITWLLFKLRLTEAVNTQYAFMRRLRLRT